MTQPVPRHLSHTEMKNSSYRDLSWLTTMAKDATCRYRKLDEHPALILYSGFISALALTVLNPRTTSRMGSGCTGIAAAAVLYQLKILEGRYLLNASRER